MQQWVISINAAVGQMLRRPRHLLVIVNPVGGNKQARYLYQSVVYPVFAKAGKDNALHDLLIVLRRMHGSLVTHSKVCFTVYQSILCRY